MDTDALEQRAAATLPPYVYDYFRATSGGPEVALESVNAWNAFRHQPRILRDTSTIDTTTTVLGTPVRTPVLVAPMALQIAANLRGEVATAEGVLAAGSLLGVSTNAAPPFAEIAAVGAPWWFQLYVLSDRTLTERLLERAVAAGAGAIILTADLTGLAHPSPGARHSINPADWLEFPPSARLGNLTEAEHDSFASTSVHLARDWSFDIIGWLRDQTGLPVVVKGVLRADDARSAVDAGASAVVVSTHGARALATSISSAAALSEVVDAVGSDAEVYVDSGLRCGAHVATALALGARAVFVGRPAMWGLTNGGSDGVRAVIDGLTAELSGTMNRLGTARISELTRDLIAR